jgi:hypothetical protein
MTDGQHLRPGFAQIVCNVFSAGRGTSGAKGLRDVSTRPTPRLLKPPHRQPPSKEQGKTVNSMSRPRYTTADDEPGSGAGGELVVEPLAESIIYLCALIADRPRDIDRYIDYFGETRPAAAGPWAARCI